AAANLTRTTLRINGRGCRAAATGRAVPRPSGKGSPQSAARRTRSRRLPAARAVLPPTEVNEGNEALFHCPRSPLFPSFTSVHIRLSQKISRQGRNGRKGRFAFSSTSPFIPSETS